MYGSWFDRELEWEEAAKKHPNFYVLYYEDLKQVILHLSVSKSRPKPDCNLSGLSDRAWIFPSFAEKPREVAIVSKQRESFHDAILWLYCIIPRFAEKPREVAIVSKQRESYHDVILWLFSLSY